MGQFGAAVESACCRDDYLRGECEVSRWDGLRNESASERCGMGERGSGVECSVLELMKRSTLRWFGHIEKMGKKKNIKKVYRSSSVEGPNRRGRPLGRWEDKVKEYLSERGAMRDGLEWARRECMDRERLCSV